MVLLTALFLLGFSYLFLLRGRHGHRLLPVLRSCFYAHRGLYGGAVPENSLAAFRAAFDRGYGAELDIHLLKDGNLAVMHDSDPFRMTEIHGCLEDLTAEDLGRFHLNGTEETIPLLFQVLSLCDGRVPLILELKSHCGNSHQLAEAVCRLLDGYQGPFFLESFDPRCLLWLKKHHPEFPRGQLSQNFFKAENGRTCSLLQFLGSYYLENFLTRPDFIAYRFRDRRTVSNFLIRKVWKIPGVSWTVENPRELDQALKEGWIPIFEGFLPEHTL